MLLIPGTSSIEHFRENLGAATLPTSRRNDCGLDLIGGERLTDRGVIAHCLAIRTSLMGMCCCIGAGAEVWV